MTDVAAASPAGDAKADDTATDSSDDSAAGSRLEEEIEEQRADAAAAVFAEEPPHAAPEPEPTLRQKPVSNSGALAAGIVGGLVTLLGFGGLQYAGIVPGLGPDRGASGIEQNISGELQALRDQIAALPTSAAVVDNTALEARIAALEQSASQPGTNGAPGAEVETLKAEIDTFTKELAGLKAALADAQQAAAAEKAELTSRIQDTRARRGADRVVGRRDDPRRRRGRDAGQPGDLADRGHQKGKVGGSSRTVTHCHSVKLSRFASPP